MSDFGIDGFMGTNSMNIFKCYQEAIENDNINEDQLHIALITNTLNELILSGKHVKRLPCYESVMGMGGIKNIWTENINYECNKCYYVGVYNDGKCVMCDHSHTEIKKGFV